MTEDEAYERFKAIKWPDGVPTCPDCACKSSWTLKGGRRWKCQGVITDAGTGLQRKCYLQYTVTSRTPLHSRKRSFCDILVAIAEFVNGVLGTAALRLRRREKNSYKTPFVFQHKIREALKVDYDQKLGGIVEVDGDCELVALAEVADVDRVLHAQVVGGESLGAEFALGLPSQLREH